MIEGQVWKTEALLSKEDFCIGEEGVYAEVLKKTPSNTIRIYEDMSVYYP